MPRLPLLGALVAAGVAAALMAASPAGAAIPASGRVATGVGPAFGPIGSSGAKALARLHLRCGRPAPGTRTRRCRDDPPRAQGGVLELDGAGRVQGWTFRSGRWTTERGVGRGSTVAAVRRAYGSSLRVRRNRTWTYLDLGQTVAGQRRVTRFVGRTSGGAIVALSVTRVRRNIIRPAQPLTDAGQDPVLRFIDFAPRATLRPEVRAPWLARPLELGALRTDARGAATLVLARGGVLAEVLAGRPAGTASPVTLTLAVAGVRRTATARVALPPLPTLAYDLPVMSEESPGTITVRNPEPRTGYRLTATWTCLDGTPDQVADASIDPIHSDTGADATAVADVGAIRGGLFNADCTGEESPATHPVTFVLSRDPGDPDSEEPGPLEAVARITVPLSSAEPPDSF